MATAKERREQREREAAIHKEKVGESQFASEQMRADAIEKVNQRAMQNPGAVADAHGEKMKPSSAGAKVTIACKLGVGYYDLQLSRLEEKWENTQTGPRKIMEARRIGPTVRIRGTAYPRGTPPLGFPDKPTIVDDAALTPDIDAEFWYAWREANKLNPLVLNNMIFAHEQRDFVIGQAKELKGINSGLEPINPKSDPRAPRTTRGDVDNVTTEDARAKGMERLNI